MIKSCGEKGKTELTIMISGQEKGMKKRGKREGVEEKAMQNYMR